MDNRFMIGYRPHDTWIDRLSGSTKLLSFVALSIIGMMTYDTRFIIAILVISLMVFKMSHIQYREVSFVIKIIIGFAILNLVMVYVFAPSYGLAIYHTQHMIWGSPHNYFNLSWEQLFYEFNLLLKYIFAVPLALIFLMTTNPSEFAASLNKIGVSYRASYSVAIALRYIPDIQSDYKTISLASQARGYELSKKANLISRIKGATQILMPLILTSLDRIEVISQAMELRRFGAKKRRTWYMARKFQLSDYITLGVVAVLVVVGILTFRINGGRFYNPFR